MKHPPNSLPRTSSAKVELIEHTADLGLRISASTPTEVIEASVTAVFSIILDPAQIEAVDEREIELTAAGYADLLCDFLNQLLYLFDAEKLVPLSVRVKTLEPTRLRASVAFGAFDKTRHGVRAYVKAVTYHQLKFDVDPAGALAEFILDV